MLTMTDAPTTQWTVAPRDDPAERSLVRAHGLPPLVAAVLVSRGWTDGPELRRYLKPDLADLHPPEALPDYAAASATLRDALSKGERIYIHGDYDVDGITSAAILTRFLRSLQADVVVHVPHRTREGYGIHKSAVAEAVEAGAKLFLTCDCGVAAFEQVALARAAGMRVIVTDHHEVGDRIPEAEAVVNPHRHDTAYPFADLCGAGVAFKLALGIAQDVGASTAGFHRAFLDLAALGTVADVMPLQGENRIIVRHGLERLAETKKPGLQSLMRMAQIKVADGVTAWDIGFRLGPRLNAAGRIDDAALALQLLMTTEVKEADDIAAQLEAINQERRQQQDEAVKAAIASVERDGLDRHPVLVVSGRSWHPGIVGLVAGRLAEHYFRPAFVATLDPETGLAKGSARTVPGFNLFEAIETLRPMLTSGGGHEMAAGFSLPYERLGEFAAELCRIADEKLPPEARIRQIAVDAQVLAEEADFLAAESLSVMEPFGAGNPMPVFLTRGLTLETVRGTRNPEHVMLVLRSPGGASRDIMGFGLGARIRDIPLGTKLDVVYTLTVDRYNGSRRLRWRLKDFARA